MTELEACVLALVARDGPLTAYQVRMEFERSRASSWRASTGSVYPMIKRLVARGLLSAELRPADGRGAAHLLATAAGRRRAQAWLTETPAWIGDVAEDPIRTRVHFLSLLPMAKRLAAIDGMAAATRASIAAIDERLKTLDRRDLDWIVFQGVRAGLAARARWLPSVRTFWSAEG